ncbi:MAG: hypothetical protein RIE73_32980 [Coleofasciculus sp. C1-SOL-03]
MLRLYNVDRIPSNRIGFVGWVDEGNPTYSFQSNQTINTQRFPLQ